MKDGNWIAIHKLVKFWLPRDRPYTELEALISHTIDIDDNKTYSVSGYSKLWQWSRTKVDRFLKSVRAEKGHHRDSHKYSAKTQLRQGVVLKLNNLQLSQSTDSAELKQEKKRRRCKAVVTTNNPNPNPETYPNKKNGFIPPKWVEDKAWNDYVAMRKSLKKPMTDRAKELAVAKLERFKIDGYDPNRILEESTMNSWQGLFKPKDAESKGDPEWLNQGR